MLESIAQQAALTGLTTREGTDYAITILELFAAAGDVLTFYNERIANELFLRTARERDSLLRLTRLIGYRMRPGLAAQTLLSFALDAGAETRIRKGLKVMSVPGQDEKPQIFETTEQIIANAEINEAAAYAPPVFFNGFALGSTGGPIVVRPAKLAVGEKLIIFGLDLVEEKTAVSLTRRADGEALAFEPAVQNGKWYGDVARAAKLEGRLRFFGHNAPEKVNVYVAPTSTSLWPKWELQTVDASLAPDTTRYPLDTRHTDIAAGTQLLIDAGPDRRAAASHGERDEDGGSSGRVQSCPGHDRHHRSAHRNASPISTCGRPFVADQPSLLSPAFMPPMRDRAPAPCWRSTRRHPHRAAGPIAI